MDGIDKNKPTWAIVTILVAIIGCIGLLGSALIQTLPDLIKPTEISAITTTVSSTTPEAQASMSVFTAVPDTLFSIASPQPTQISYSPLASEYISIKGYVGVVNSSGLPGNMKYSHLVTGKIKYNRVEADDDVIKVELVCAGNQISDITSSFFLINQPVNSVFPNYASNEFNVPVNCRVDFTVADIGGQTGITINSVAIP